MLTAGDGHMKTLTLFNADYNWMLKESAGYAPWLKNHDTGFGIGMIYPDVLAECLYNKSAYSIIQRITRSRFMAHPLLDIFFKALVRAEIRLIGRYIPQRSNEERLTGHFVSEIDNAICNVKWLFEKESIYLYGEKRTIDFFYYDLSKGGKIEKQTGADLGFVLRIDLPDYPRYIQAVNFQAKKIEANFARINKEQHKTLEKKFPNNPAYIFYDTDIKRLTSPLACLSSELAVDFTKEKDSSSVNYDDIAKKSIPFSLFILNNILKMANGLDTLEKALSPYMDNEIIRNHGKIAVVSLGTEIKTTIKDTGDAKDKIGIIIS
jgi:hypothetical protein